MNIIARVADIVARGFSGLSTEAGAALYRRDDGSSGTPRKQDAGRDVPGEPGTRSVLCQPT